jgi:coenzyme F420-dependent glucose-6-phosphate dehydrogenase
VWRTPDHPVGERKMTRFGYHVSHEQFAPSDLLRWTKCAEAAGFDCAMSSDHFHPWSERQGQSGFAWSWLGAAMEATKLPFGIISAPGYRYHPAVIAQGAATLSQMYPDRLWLALGSGEAINESITGAAWPDKQERNARLFECAQIIRALFAGETVTHRGRVTVVEATLYTRPAIAPMLVGAATSESTAGMAGQLGRCPHHGPRKPGAAKKGHGGVPSGRRSRETHHTAGGAVLGSLRRLKPRPCISGHQTQQSER